MIFTRAGYNMNIQHTVYVYDYDQECTFIGVFRSEKDASDYAASMGKTLGGANCSYQEGLGISVYGVTRHDWQSNWRDSFITP